MSIVFVEDYDSNKPLSRMSVECGFCRQWTHRHSLKLRSVSSALRFLRLPPRKFIVSPNQTKLNNLSFCDRQGSKNKPLPRIWWEKGIIFTPHIENLSLSCRWGWNLLWRKKNGVVQGEGIRNRGLPNSILTIICFFIIFTITLVLVLVGRLK